MSGGITGVLLESEEQLRRIMKSVRTIEEMQRTPDVLSKNHQGPSGYNCVVVEVVGSGSSGAVPDGDGFYVGQLEIRNVDLNPTDDYPDWYYPDPNGVEVRVQGLNYETLQEGTRYFGYVAGTLFYGESPGYALVIVVSCCANIPSVVVTTGSGNVPELTCPGDGNDPTVPIDQLVEDGELYTIYAQQAIYLDENGQVRICYYNETIEFVGCVDCPEPEWGSGSGSGPYVPCDVLTVTLDAPSCPSLNGTYVVAQTQSNGVWSGSYQCPGALVITEPCITGITFTPSPTTPGAGDLMIEFTCPGLIGNFQRHGEISIPGMSGTSNPLSLSGCGLILGDCDGCVGDLCATVQDLCSGSGSGGSGSGGSCPATGTVNISGPVSGKFTTPYTNPSCNGGVSGTNCIYSVGIGPINGVCYCNIEGWLTVDGVTCLFTVDIPLTVDGNTFSGSVDCYAGNVLCAGSCNVGNTWSITGNFS